MSSKALLDEINRLPLGERLRLVEQIWNGIAASPTSVPMPDWHRTELDRRLDYPAPEPSLSTDELHERLHKLG
jgi:putative addiction module component (TIGR02574 family)